MADERKANTGNNGLPQPPAENGKDPLQGIFGSSEDCKYIKRKLLGQGSFGSAWRVEEKATKRLLAAKLMDLNNMSEKDRGFVTNEVKCLSRCNCPNIVRCEDSVQKDGLLLIIMEYADGGDLYKQIKARQQTSKYFKEHEVMFIFLQLCLALEHIHSNKMMHRDLKTANILLTTTGLLKLGDFGFSRQYEDSLSNAVGTTFCGTPYYLSPELWHRQSYSKKSEMWALGVVLYEVMALKRPFGGRNMDELISNICNARYNPLPTSYSEPLRNVCERLLSIDPERRPTMRQLFSEPFIRKGLETLTKSVERHNKIPREVCQQIAQCIATALENSDNAALETPEIVPKEGIVARHTAASGWQDCKLSLSPDCVRMVSVESGKEEVLPLNTITSVCAIDEDISGDKYVFAMKNNTGRGFWFRASDEKSFSEWISALQIAVSR